MLSWHPHILEVNRQDVHGLSPVHHAILQKNFEELQRLLSHPCILINLADNNKKMPLHYAIELNFREATDLLLKKDADIDAKDNYGNSVLHYVAAFGTREILRTILEMHPPILQNHRAQTPIDFAILFNNFHLLMELNAYCGTETFNLERAILPINEKRVRISAYLNFITLFWQGMYNHNTFLDQEISTLALRNVIDNCVINTKTFLRPLMQKSLQPYYEEPQEKNLTIRIALNRMYSWLSDQMREQQIAEVDYSSNYVDSMQVVLNKFNIPISFNAYSTYSVHSWFFSFFQLNEFGCLSYNIEFPPMDFFIDPKHFLNQWSYRQVQDIQPYDLALYGTQYESEFQVRHIGIINNSGKVVSKFGTLPEVWCHNVNDVALEFGNNILIFRKSSNKTAYGQFKMNVEKILQNHSSKEEQMDCVQNLFKNFKSKIFRQSLFGEQQLLWAKKLMQKNNLYLTNYDDKPSPAFPKNSA